MRYIHFNPQKHGFAGDFREYPYSSYQTMLSDEATRLKRDVVLEWFGDRAAFVEFYEDLPGFGNLAGLVGDDDSVRDLAGLSKSARK